MTRAESEAAHMSAPDHGPHRSRKFLLLPKGRPHRSQSSGVHGSLGIPADFATSEPEVAHAPERPCREAEAPVQRRFQGPALRGGADPAGRLLVFALSAERSQL